MAMRVKAIMLYIISYDIIFNYWHIASNLLKNPYRKYKDKPYINHRLIKIAA